MQTIDGSIGEGGGQILRSALALSLCTGKPFRILNIRRARARPGLQPQHLAAVKAAADVADASTSGADLGSSELTFEPRRRRTGRYCFAIGTAGSTTLVLQTVLPALLTADGPSELEVEGGTHNPQAPTYDFIARSYLPIVGRMGPGVQSELLRAGFYPAGGGRLRVRIEPSSPLAPFELETRGAVRSLRAEILLCKLPAHIAQREAAVLEAALPELSESVVIRRIDNSLSAGNVVSLFCESESLTEVFTACGQRGVPAERVAGEAVAATRAYLAADVPVGPYLADQLLLPLGLAGAGSFVTMQPTRHTLTNIAIIEQMLDLTIGCKQISGSERWRVEISTDRPRQAAEC